MGINRVRHDVRMWIKRLMMSPDVWFKKVIPANIRHIVSKPLEKRVIRKTKIPIGNDLTAIGVNLLDGEWRTIEVNGANAPADKWYRGIYTFDMSKCWWGGNPRKDMISAADGVEFYGPTFKYVQEYGVERVVTDRGAWSDITTSRDDYGTHGNVRKCYHSFIPYFIIVGAKVQLFSVIPYSFASFL